MLHEELLQGVVAGDEHGQTLPLASAGSSPLLPQAGHGARVAHCDGGIEGPDVYAQLERARADHSQQPAAEEHLFYLAALLGCVAGSVGSYAFGQARVDVFEQVYRLLVDDLSSAARLGEADGAHAFADELGEQLGGLGVGAPAQVELVFHQRRLPEDDLATAERRAVSADVRDLETREVFGVLASIADGRRGKYEARVGTVERGDSSEPSEDVGHVAAEHPSVGVGLVDDHVLEVEQEVVPALVPGQ